jgi:hypothetical protein
MLWPALSGRGQFVAKVPPAIHRPVQLGRSLMVAGHRLPAELAEAPLATHARFTAC